MNTLFGNNVVNNHGENKANEEFHQSAPANNYSNNFNQTSDAGYVAEQQTIPGFDDVPSFRSLEFKDGHIDTGSDEEWIERKKCTMSEIAGQPIIIRGVYERQSKLYEDNKYISINFVNQNGEECFVNTSGKTIKKQIDEKNMQYPFRAVIKACPKKDNPNMKYYKLS